VSSLLALVRAAKCHCFADAAYGKLGLAAAGSVATFGGALRQLAQKFRDAAIGRPFLASEREWQS
jgi:hypothetical protein